MLQIASNQHIAELVGKNFEKLKVIQESTNTQIYIPSQNEKPFIKIFGADLNSINMAQKKILAGVKQFDTVFISKRSLFKDQVEPGVSVNSCYYYKLAKF